MGVFAGSGISGRREDQKKKVAFYSKLRLRGGTTGRTYGGTTSSQEELKEKTRCDKGDENPAGEKRAARVRGKETKKK